MFFRSGNHGLNHPKTHTDRKSNPLILYEEKGDKSMCEEGSFIFKSEISTHSF